MDSGFKRAMRNSIVAVSRAVPQSLRSGLAASSYGGLARRILNRFSGETHPIVHLGGPMAGQRMRVNWALHKTYAFGTHEPQVTRALQEIVRPGWTAIDVGGHIGYVTLLLAKLVGPQGRVIAFEPLAENFKMLQENIQLNGHTHVTAENFAVMSRSGGIDLRSATPGALTWVATVDLDEKSAVESQHVEAVTLDDYVERHGIRKVDFVKIDVEGAEASVLDGFKNVLQRDRPLLLIELHALDQYQEKHPALLRLREQNYKIKSVGMRGWQEHVIAEP